MEFHRYHVKDDLDSVNVKQSFIQYATHKVELLVEDTNVINSGHHVYAEKHFTTSDETFNIRSAYDNCHTLLIYGFSGSALKEHGKVTLFKELSW